jgi:hypothetical protein
MAIKRALQGDYDHVAFSALGVDGTEQGNRFGAMYVAYQVAKQIGLPEVLGGGRKGRLALLLVLAQLISPMSKRAVVQWAENEAVYEVLGLGAPRSCQSFSFWVVHVVSSNEWAWGY